MASSSVSLAHILMMVSKSTQPHAICTNMGDPDASDGYLREVVWQYRTALIKVAQGVEADFTAVVFDERRTRGVGKEFPG
jgi:hypothetical protein